MRFKADTISKIKRVLKYIYTKYPHLQVYSESSVLEYFKDIVPLLHEELDSYELEVLVELMCLEISGTYSEKFYKLKKIYDAIVLFKVDPVFVIGEYFDEIKGFSGFAGKCPRDTEE